MNFRRRQFLRLTAGAFALPAFSRVARAQAYPTRPVRIIVSAAAGGSSDIVARLMGQWLSERLSQQFIIDNRPGGGNNIGATAAINAAPDGYTLYLANSANAINATLYQKLNFNFIRDVTPVAGLIRMPNVQSLLPGQDRSRFHSLCQGQSGQNQFRLIWHRNFAPCDWRAVQDDGGS
jgi:tripartite-type tricarboxylate transporter receptor subunit TctC